MSFRCSRSGRAWESSFAGRCSLPVMTVATLNQGSSCPAPCWIYDRFASPNAVATGSLLPIVFEVPRDDDLEAPADFYFGLRVTMSKLSRKEQRRDIGLFLAFLRLEIGGTERRRWTPHVSADFLEHLGKHDGSIGPAEREPDRGGGLRPRERRRQGLPRRPAC